MQTVSFPPLPFFAATPIIVARVCAALLNALYSAVRNEIRIPTDASFHSTNEKYSQYRRSRQKCLRRAVDRAPRRQRCLKRSGFETSIRLLKGGLKLTLAGSRV